MPLMMRKIGNAREGAQGHAPGQNQSSNATVTASSPTAKSSHRQN